MARNRAAASNEGQASGEFPEGFTEISTPDLEGWWVIEKGVSIKGQLVGRIVVPDNKGDRDVVLIQLAAPAKATDPERNEVMLEAGQILAVGIRHKLKDLLNYVEHRAWAIITPTEKIGIGSGQTMWKFKIGVKGKRSAPVEPARTSRASNEDDDIPDF